MSSISKGEDPSASYFSHARKASEDGKKAPSVQDRLFDKLFSSLIPELPQYDDSDELNDRMKDGRPQLSIPLLTWNFRRFSARIGVAFNFQWSIIRLVAWRRPTQTLSALSIYSFLCLNPYLFAVLPLVWLMVGLMVPAYIARHPPPPSALPAYPMPSHGPPLAPPMQPHPAPEMSRDFLMNMRDIQNLMDDYSNIYDHVIATIAPPTNFSSEALSATVFLFLTILSFVIICFASVIPWRQIMLIAGWCGVGAFHPTAQRYLQKRVQSNEKTIAEKRFLGVLDAWISNDIIDDELPQRETVEVYEIQRRKNYSSAKMVAEWQDWVYSSSAYEPQCAARISQQRPVGTRFRDDVTPPPGWRFLDSFRWKMDESAVWVEERQIAGVVVEEDGWVVDSAPPQKWRRRRWTRFAERKKSL